MRPELPTSRSGRAALALLALLAGVKAAGWILLATALARGITWLAERLPAPESSDLLGLLFAPDPASYDPLAHGLLSDAAGTTLAQVVALGLAGVLARAAATWGQQVFSRRAALGAKEELRHRMVAHRLASAGAGADRAGEDSVLASSGLDGLDKYFTQYLPALLTAAVMPLMLGVWILTHDWVSALVLVLTIPLIPVFMVLIGQYTEDRVQQAAEGLDRLSHHVLELARGLPVLVGLRRAGTQRQALAGVSDRYRATTMTTLKTAFMSGFALELISTLSVAVVAVFIGVRLVYGELDLYTGLLVLTLAPEVYLPFRDIGSAHHASEDGVEALRRARAGLDRPVPASLSDVLGTDVAADGEPAVAPVAQAATGQDAGPGTHPSAHAREDRLVLRGLGIAYRDPDGGTFPAVVGHLDLDLAPGELTVLGGPSGTGKTTVLSALTGVLRCGEAEFTGTAAGLAGRRVVWLGQHPAFSEPTVGAELALYAVASAGPDGAPGRDGLLVADALAACGLDGFAPRHPDELSPGERRRLGLARVLVRLMAGPVDSAAWLIVLDEPTAHLDAENAQRIRAVLAALRSGHLPGGRAVEAILLVASHDRDLQALADRVIGAPKGVPQRLPASPEPQLTQQPDVTYSSGTPVPDHDGSAVTAAAAETPTAVETPSATGADPRTGTSLSKRWPRWRRWRGWLRLLPLTDRTFIAGVAWATAATLAAALLSALSGWLIVQAAYQPPVLYLLSVIVLVRFFGIGRALFRYLERLDTHDAVLAWANRIRLRLWDALGSQAAQWGRLTRSGGALSVLVADVDELRDALPRVIVPVPAAVISWLITVLIVALMAPAAWWPAVVAGLAGLVLVPLVVGLADRQTTRALTDHRTGLLQRTTALFAATPDLAGNGAAALAADRFGAADRAADRPLRRNAAATGFGQALASLLSGWAAVQTLVLCVQNGVTAPVTAMVVFLLLALAEPLGLYSTACQEAAILSRQLAKTAPLLTAENDSGSASDPAPDSARDNATEPEADAGADLVSVTGIELSAAAVRYPGTATDVFRDLDLSVRRGQLAVVTGPSGSGKSTLLAVLLGFLGPRQGRYVLESTGGPVDSSDAALSAVAWCPQDAYLFDSTLRSNLNLARDPEDRPSDGELISVLELVGLGDWLDAAPDGLDGLDTRVGPSGHFLSGGQRQRVAVARALLARADVVLLDEPTAHLGADEAADLVADLRAALADRTAVMVTHDRRFAGSGQVHLELDGAGGVSPR
ncbi:thiol reductant ABC exporter subunit CydC [Citricoccus sp. K5]|uniref:thiol reductant ABC exporter subunit CydC n=1 Tax=Citricoccus sp. K5 TaxID=2653135 RepID=UPI0012F37FF9|nr:thiol reductant ABC exporter subunit CydC [Citricoccus sp. K5]VXB44384.1 Transport ATP-binding protein CydCD [Citricoccus sp. K5]